MPVEPQHAGIYANALPYLRGRVDLYDLDRDGDQIALALWEATAARNLSATLHLPEVPAAAVQELYFQTRNHARTHGAHCLGLGYPTLLCYAGAQLITAPLLIFDWHFEPSLRRSDTWMVQHNHRHRIRANEWLLGYIQDKSGKDLRTLFKRATRRPDKANLQRLCDEVADALELDSRAEISYPTPFPDVDRLGALGEKGALLASGVVAQFIPAAFDTLTAITHWDDPLAAPELPTHQLAPLALDPAQTTAVRRAMQHRCTLVEGAERSGKDRVATWLLLNAVSNGQRSLVVADSVPALRKLQRKLVEAGYNDGQYLLRAVADDFPQLMQVFRVIAARNERNAPALPADYAEQLAATERLRVQFDTQYAALRTPVFGTWYWTETVARLLTADRQEPKEQLATQLAPKAYEWTLDEYNDLQESLGRCRPLYARLQQLDHPLTALDDAIFLHRDAADARQFIGRELDRLREEVGEVEDTYIRTLERYLTDLRDWEYRFAERLEGQVDRWLERLAERQTAHGASLDATTSWWIRMTLKFRPKWQTIRGVRREIRDEYERWRGMHQDVQPFAANLPPAERLLPDELRQIAQQYKNALQKWRNEIPGAAHQAVERLTARQSFPALGYENELLQLERQAQLVRDRFNAAGLYRAPVESRALTISGQRNELTELRSQLQQTHQQLADFRAFYNWQSVWLRQSEKAQALVRALVAAQPKDWAVATESWYLYELLSRVPRQALPESDELLEALATAMTALEDPMRAAWAQDRSEAIQASLRQLRSTDRRTYQAWMQGADPLEAPMAQLLELAKRTSSVWRAAFPVLLTTPAVARELFAQTNAPFDQLLILGGDRLQPSDVRTLAPMAERTVIFGSTPNDKADSLLHHLREADWPATQLTGPLSGATAAAAEVRVVEVDGRYTERERVNEVEVQTVVQELLRVQPTEDRRLPRVGVVCFSEAQRNLIAAHLLEIKQRNGYGSEHIAQLERNGLGLYTIDELYGLSLDVLILSLTFGRLRQTGDWGRSLQFFDRPEATFHFNYLLHFSVDQLVIIHSLPRATIENYLLHAADQGSYLLASYLSYYQAVANDELVAAQAYLTHFTEDADAAPESLSMGRELGEFLSEYVGKQRVTIHEIIAEHAIDLTIANREALPGGLALKADGYFADAPYSDARWELRQRKKIRGAGFELLPVWTKFWWNNAAQAARKLAARVIVRDKEVRPFDS